MENNQTVYAPFDELRDFMKLGFIAVGVPENDAATCADVLIESDKRGIDSHGVGRFKPIYIDRIKAGIQHPVTNFEIVKESPTTAVVDGHDGMGHVIGTRCMQMAIDKAKKYGTGMVVARNSTHYGIAGYYVLMAAKNDCIGFSGTNARPSIAPTFGVENMLGTNPLTFGMPTDEGFPFVIDCATSITQRGKIEHYNRIGKTMPKGWVLDRTGAAVTDPATALKGLTEGTCALAPLGGIGDELAGYKGYGWATVVEILSAALQQGAFLKALSNRAADGSLKPYHLGHFFMAVDISAFCDPAVFKKTTGDILRELRASKKAAGHDRIWTGGEKEHDAFLKRSKEGVPLNPAVRESLEAVRNENNVKFTFSWEK
jgi:LDH2 family malate/lactate/ureidoglycolate dehydrogenase